MKILYLVPDINFKFNQIGGAGTHIRASILHLEKKNIVIRAIGGDILNYEKRVSYNKKEDTTRRSFIQIIKRIIPSEVKKTIYDYRRRALNERILNEVELILKREGIPDIIYERSCYGYDVGMKISQKYAIKRCMETDVIMLDLIKEDTSFLFNRIFYRLMEKAKYHTADSIAVQSEYSVEICKKYWGIKHGKVFNKDLGITLTNYKNNLNYDIDARYNIKGQFLVAYVGVFQAYQYIPVLLKAAKLITDPEIVIFIIGDGINADKYKSYVKSNNIKNVIFTGLVDKELMVNYYQRIDLSVITDCAYHMYPVKFLEFGGFSIPTIIPRYEVFKPFYKSQDDYESLSFKPKDSFELAHRIKTIKDNYFSYKEKVNFTNNYIINNNTWEECGKKIEFALYKTLGIDNEDIART